MTAVFPMRRQSDSSVRNWRNTSSRGSCLTSSMRFLPSPALSRRGVKLSMQPLFEFPRNAIPAMKTRGSKKEILLKLGAKRRSVRRTRTPAGFRRMGRTTTATRTMWKRMSNTKSFGITRLRMPPFTTAMCLKSSLMKTTQAGMFMRTARIVQGKERRI